MFRGIFGLPGQNRDRGRVRPVDKIRNLGKKSFSKIIITPLLRTRPDFCECNLNEFSIATGFFCLAGLGGKAKIENLSLIFLFKKKSFFIETPW